MFMLLSWRRSGSWLIAVIGLALSCLAFVAARHSEMLEIRAELDGRADWLGRDIQYAITGMADSVTAMAVYAAVESPPRAERFRQFAEQVRDFGGPAFRIVWQPRVPAEQRTAFEAAARAETQQAFEILEFDAAGAMVPAGSRPEYFPMLHDVPLRDFTPRRGLDLASNPDRRRDMDRARDAGAAVAGLGPFQSAKRRGELGYFLFWPIYQGGRVPVTVEDRRARLTGYVTGVFVLSEVLAQSLDSGPDRIETVPFLPGAKAAAVQPIHPRGAATNPAGAAALRLERSFAVNNLSWTLAFEYAHSAIDQRRSPAPWAYLALGLVLTAMLVRHLAQASRALETAEAERLRADTALSASEQRFRAFAEIASDWMWEVDEKLDFTWFSDSASARSGGRISPLGSSAMEMPVPDAHAPGLRQLRAAAAARQPFHNVVIQRLDPDGTIRHFRVSGTPRLDGERFLGYRGVTTDITSEIQTQARLVDAIEALPAGFMLFDRDERLILANTAVRAIFHEAAGEIRPGATFETMMGTIAARQVPSDAIGRGDDWVRERLLRFRGGDGDWLQGMADGHTLHVIERHTSEGGKLIVYADLTRLKESEQRLRVTLDAVPSGLLVVDDKGIIVMVNAQLKALTGYTRLELIGSRMEMLVPERHRHEHAGHRGGYMASASARPMGTGRDLYGQRRDGTEIPIEIGLSPVRTTRGNFVIASLVDISERKQMEEALRQAQKMEAVGQLTGGVAHDFNNLLSVIVGNLELMAENTEDAATIRRLRTVLRAANRGAELTHRLLAFSRRQSLQPKATALPELLTELRALLVRTIGETIAIEISAAPDVAPCMVDRGQLENAVLNLVINARDAMPHGGRVTIVARNANLGESEVAPYPEALPGDYVEIAVVDRGEGMTEEIRRRAVEPFFTTKEVGKGSGLGLSMVYGFVKQSGGFVSLESTPGTGTTVRLFLPQAALEVDAEAGSNPDAKPTPRRSGTALVVEDQPDVRRTSAMRLENMGFRVLQAADGPAALALIEANPDIVLLFSDVVMPGGMDGFALAQAARRLRPSLPVLLTTGYAGGTTETRERILFKPYHNRDLADAVDAALAAA